MPVQAIENLHYLQYPTKEGIKKSSTSGKTFIIASTEGNQSVPGRETLKVGLNVYKKK